MINTVFAQLSQQGHPQPSAGSGEKKQPYAFTFKTSHRYDATSCSGKVTGMCTACSSKVVHHNARREVCSVLSDEFTGVSWNTKNTKNSLF